MSAVLAVIVAASTCPVAAAAQEEPPPTTEAPPAPAPEAPPPPPPGNGTAPPVPTDNPAEATEAPPTDPVVVPEPEVPPPPDPAAPVLQQVTGATLAVLRRSVRQAAEARAVATRQVETLTTEVAELEVRLAQLEADEQAAVARLQHARELVRRRAVASYVGNPSSQLNLVLESEDFNQLGRRLGLLGAVARADKARIQEYDAARNAVGAELAEVVSGLDQRRASLTVAQGVLAGASSTLKAKEIMFEATKTGGELFARGFAFPVGGPHTFADTFGAPRMTGTVYEHLHEGTDIFAAYGTPLVACERGVVTRVGSDTLGGTKLWLVGASGTRYYYAHLSSFAEGVAEGMVVSPGDVVGYVGNTGNALTTPPHLHFEVHPGGGPAVNPFPLLKIVDDVAKRMAASSGAQRASVPAG